MAAPLAHESYLMHEKHLSVVARFHDKAAPLLLGGNGNLRGLPTPLPPAPPPAGNKSLSRDEGVI